MTIPLDQGEFLVGLGAGFAALLIVLLMWRGRPSHERPWSIAGLLIAVATCVALWLAGGFAVTILTGEVALPPGLAVGLAVLAGGGVVLRRLNFGRILVGGIFVLGGASIVVTRAGIVDVTWIRLLVAAVVVGGGSLLADFDRRWRSSGLGPVLLAVSAVGVYYTVPDPEEAMVFLGVVLPMALLAWPVPIAALGTVGSFVVAGLFAWTVAAGGFGRESSIVGGISCLGLLVVEPLARLLRRPDELGSAPRLQWWQVPAVGLAHLGLVYVGSRIAGLQATVAAAVAISLLELAGGTIAVACLIPGRVRSDL